MLQTFRPSYHSPNAKTAQIMARYRPIAPKPQALAQNPPLATVLPHLHAGPTRTRKRGRTSLGPPGKRLRSTYLHGLLSPPNYQFPPLTPPATSDAGFSNLLPDPNATEKGVIDLNKPIDLEEKDLLLHLESPTVTVIKPKPVRLVSSTITVWSIKEEPKPGQSDLVLGDNLEEDVESKVEPVVVTDSKNRVRVVSSGYKELVGQPECLWLDTVGRCNGQNVGTVCKRICGEVILLVLNSGLAVPIVSNGFSGRGQIEWESTGNKRFVDVFFVATKMCSESKDYQFAWRFYNPEASQSTDYEV